MIRYKIMCENNTLLCEKKENNRLIFIKKEQSFIEIVNEFINKGYTVTINGKDMILNGNDSYIYLQDYKTLLSSLCLSSLRSDILSHIASDGVMSLTPKRKSKKNRKNKKNKDFNIELPDYDSSIKYYSKNRRKMFKTYFHHFLEYALLLTLSFSTIKFNSTATDSIYANKAIVDEKVNNSASYFMTISDALALRPVNEGLSPYRFDEMFDRDEEVLPATGGMDDFPIEATSSAPVEENHDDEYREAIYKFLVKEELTLDQFSNLLTAMVDGNSPFTFNYKNEAEVFKDLCFRDDRSLEEKMMIILIRDNIKYDELDSVCAGCVSESCQDGECYDDAYAVASTILNRINDVYYVGNYGTNPYSQFIAPNQFSVYASGAYLEYLGRRDLPAYQAAVDALYSKESMHQYLEFRASWVDVPYHHESFVDGGNQFLVKQKDSRVLVDEEFEVNKDEIMSLVLEY